MNHNISIKQWIGNFLTGEYADKDVDVQITAGWYDWFCKDTSLAAKTTNLGKKLISLFPSKKIDADNMYVFFKNNCPIHGSLYDDFRICDLNTGKVIYTIVPKDPHNEGKSTVFGCENDFNGPLVKGKWKDVIAYFKA
jgi:hypothetical protein